jgi:hypothetical protein
MDAGSPSTTPDSPAAVSWSLEHYAWRTESLGPVVGRSSQCYGDVSNGLDDMSTSDVQHAKEAVAIEPVL